MAPDTHLRDYARLLLAAIRLFNGGAALLAPGFLARQIGVDPQTNPGVLYVFRMFGIRTVLIGADLLLQDSQRRHDAVRRAPLVHASDTVAAILAARSGQIPRGGRVIVAISALNTLLAVVANR
jgi:hypothetical protein